ncbi:MAG: DUF3127 domain-containing protein [Spirosomataceae bacterium]
MALELTATLVKLMPEVTGAGKNGAWRKQEFIVETQDQYPKKVCFSVWGDKVGDLNQFTIGDVLKVSFNLESRDYNDRWYTDARAWRIELADSNTIAQPSTPASSPSSFGPPKSTFNDTLPSFSEDGADELPF